ncbi:unnamed protein product [Cunninghamella blakesleeana]
MNHGPQLISLQLDIKDIIIMNEIQQQQQRAKKMELKQLLQQQQQKDKEDNHSDGTIDDDDHDHDHDHDHDYDDEKYIRIQYDIQPQILPNSQYYYGRVIYFPSYFTQLKELYLCFKSISYRSSVAEYMLDERTLESLHQSCPLLESLSLNYLVLNCLEIISRVTSSSTSTSTTTNEITTANINVTPCESLKQLYLINCKLYQYGNYIYLSKKYPQLTTLHMHLQWKDDHHFYLLSPFEENDPLLRHRQQQSLYILNANINGNMNHNNNNNHNSNNMNHGSFSCMDRMNNSDKYRYMVYEMITSFQYLKELSAEFIYVNDFSNVKWQDGFWPGKEFLLWLIQHPDQLRVLNYPYDLSTMEYDMKKKIRNNEKEKKEKDTGPDDDDGGYFDYYNYYDHYDIFQRRAYLDHLTTLILNTEEEFSSTLHYLLRDGKQKTASSSITNLTIKKEKGIMTHFFLFDWLDAFPKLKSLTLSGVGLIDDKEYKMGEIPIDHDNNNNNNNDDNVNDDEMNELKLIEDNMVENQWNELNYPLKELIISSSSIFLMGGLSIICKVCPLLRVLKLAYVDFFGYLSPLELTAQLPQFPYLFLNRINCIVIDAPHLNLDEFSISSVRCGDYWKQFNEAEMTELIVDEIGANRTFKIIEPSKLKPPTNVVLRCNAVDTVNYSNNH